MKHLLFCAVLLLGGCDKIDKALEYKPSQWEIDRTEVRTNALKQGTKNCLDKKGIPIFDGWGDLKDCK